MAVPNPKKELEVDIIVEVGEGFLDERALLGLREAVAVDLELRHRGGQVTELQIAAGAMIPHREELRGIVP